MSAFRLGPDGIYRCEAFGQFPWQEHGFGTRMANPEANVVLKQIHSARIWNANALSTDPEEGDALIGNEIGVSIGVRTADCVPILLLDEKRRAVAAVHAGWRGTAAGIVPRSIASMTDAFETNVKDVWAAIGPCVGACCYEVGGEVAAQFAGLFPEWTAQNGGTRRLDLAEANRRQLVAGGVPEQHILHSGLCTSCESETFFSYRREPVNPGRMVAAIKRIDSRIE